MEERNLSPKEAWDKYVKDPNNIPDEFYTSQGLDPKAQREAVDRLNHPEKFAENVASETKEVIQTVSEEVEKTVENGQKIAKNASETLEKAANTAEKAANSAEKAAGKGMTSHSISGKGKAAIALAVVAGVVMTSEHKSQKNANSKFTGKMSKKERKRAEKLEKMQGYSNTTMMYTGMEQQMAADISGYHYGKHMTGFMNA